MDNRRRNHIRSKWTKTSVILRDRAVRSYVPETRRMSPDSLRRMIARYSMVYVKPVSGTYGNGVMKVSRTKGGYTCWRKRDERRFRSFNSLYRWVERRANGKPYIVQKGIRLLTYRGRLFDIRVMVQKNPRNVWETTGIIGRVAHPEQIVTNYHSGGKPTDVRILLRPYVRKSQMPALMRRLAKVSRLAAEALHKGYPGVNMVGSDIGLDASLKPWIIELNTSPDPYLFRFLKDKSVSRKVIRYAKALGRIP